MKPRAPRPGDHWAVKKQIVEALAEFTDDLVEKALPDESRPDIYRVIAAMFLLGRRGEAVTAASVASALRWQTPRARVALAALEERGIARRRPARRRRAGDLFDEIVVAKAAVEAEPAGNPLDPRAEGSSASGGDSG